MNYLNIANSRILFICAAGVIGIVLLQSIFFLRLAWKRGKEIGIDVDKMKQTVKTSAIFSIVPSLPIVISLIAIVGIIGIPFSWLRLSIIGSAPYELISADIGAKSMGVEKLGAAGYTSEVFSNSMWVMTIGIIWGLLMCIFFLNRYQNRLKNIQQKDSKWAEILINALFFGMLSVFIGEPVVTGGSQLIVLIFSGLVMLLLTLLANSKKINWLHNFSLAISMVSGMGLAVLISTYL